MTIFSEILKYEIKKLRKLKLLKKFYKLFLIPGVCGILLGLSFPKFDLSIFIFVSLVIIFWLLSARERNVLDIITISFSFGITSFSLRLYWIVYTLVKYGQFPTILALFLLILLSSYLSLYYFLFFYLSTQIKAYSSPSFFRGILIGLFWVAIEFLCSILFTGFPWGLIGYPLSNFSLFLQLADLLGIWGLSFTVIMLNYFIYFLINKASRYLLFTKDSLLNLLFFGIFFLLILSYGHYTQNKWKKEVSAIKQNIKVALLQGNIPQELKAAKEIEISLFTYKNLILKAFKEEPQLIFLPETALPFYFLYEKEPTLKFLSFLEELKSINKGKGEELPRIIFGAFRVSFNSEGSKVHNTLFVWDGENISDFYDKENLVPFGEYVPLSKYFPFLKKISVVSDILKPGISKNLKVYLKPLRIEITPLICFESAFPQISQKKVKMGGELIFVATNDAWFGKTSAAYQHFQIAKVRAVETRRFVLQAANTGITGIIDPLGKTIKESVLEIEEIIIDNIKTVEKQTPFVNYGYIFPYIATALFLLVCFLNLFKAFRKSHRFEN
ncbi:MAG: apolipoprotein N-acyltransferase [Caldimicrobium sp.]